MTLDCVRHVRVWHDGDLVTSEIPLEQLPAELSRPGRLAWVDLVDPSVDDLRYLVHELQLDPGAVEDLTAPHERPKVARRATCSSRPMRPHWPARPGSITPRPMRGAD